MTSAAATSIGYRRPGGQVAPAPQLRDDASEMTDEQAEALRRVQEDAEGMTAERTIGQYEEKKGGKIGKITKKSWYIIDPRTSGFITYWDGFGMVSHCPGDSEAWTRAPAWNHSCTRSGRTHFPVRMVPPAVTVRA